MTRRIEVEVCVDSVDGCVAAEAGGADRVELCADLLEGGTTPSAGAIAVARASIEIGLYVLVRPRAGDFLYTRAELEVLERDVRTARELGADGVALGVLHADGTVDRERTERLVERARPMQVTFHRAFDACPDLLAALAVLGELGVERVLTSGGAPSAPLGAATIRRCVEAFPEGPALVAAGGVRADNVAHLVETAGVREVHFTARELRRSAMRTAARTGFLASGTPPAPDELFVTDPRRVAATIAALRVGAPPSP